MGPCGHDPSGSGGSLGGSLSVVQRSRKPHTRSRTGCLTCRQRHLRCDEKRPICINCSSAAKQCEYPATGIPLRDRRKTWLPGEQQPWTTQSTQMPMMISFEIDPFNALPNRMPFRSTELFHYFCKSQEPIGYDASNKGQDCLALATQNADSLRGSLLIAALHYAWNVGNLHNYESTFLFHKVEAMRLVNEWLKNLHPKLAAVCIKEICTLAFTECCLGDVDTADTHIDGLMRFMDFHRPTTLKAQPSLGLKDELANRYILFTYSFVHGIKSRVSDILGSDCGPTPADVEAVMHQWHIDEEGGLETRLKSMRLFPSFFSVPPSGTECQDIDAFPLVECLRKFTQMAHIRTHLEVLPLYDSEGPRDEIWLEGAATRLLLAMVNSHVQSISGKRGQKFGQRSPKELRVSWAGNSAATGLYLNAVLGAWNAGQLLDDRLHRRVLFILKGHLDREEYFLELSDTATSDFWFWRAFTGAFSIEKHRKYAEAAMSSAFRPSFRSFIATWIQKTKIYQWASAKKRLESIAWPPKLVDESLAVEIWQNAAMEAEQCQAVRPTCRNAMEANKNAHATS